jgi:serine/threonine protein kinase/WD40 repeat protein
MASWGWAVDRLEAGDPSHIGPFRLLGRLGEGGMGRVFLGASPGGRKVAIKVVHPRHANDPAFRRRFAHEVAAARQVGGFHAALVVDADPDADPPWMATAYIPGPSLADAIVQRGSLDEAGVRDLGAALAEGLGAIHACGIIHRDLKPGNVILADDGPRIIDFGIAKSADASSLTASNAVLGTLRYMSPEQLNGQKLTEQSDIFALGAILTYAATGHNPFDGATMPAIIAQILNNPPNLDPLTGELRDIISACLAREPGDRPSAADVLVRFNLLKPASELTPAGPAEPVHTALQPREASQVRANDLPRAAARVSSPVSTIDAGLDAPRPAEPRATPTRGARPLRRQPQHRRYRPSAIMAAAGAVVAVGLAVALVVLSDKPPATVSSATGWVAETLFASTSRVASSVAFGPNGTLATGDQSGHTYLWNTANSELAATLTDSASGGVFSVAFGPGGILAAGENDGRTDLWNTATRTHTTPLSDISAQVVFSVAFGPGRTLATDQIHATDIWNTATGKLITRLIDPGTGGVFSVAFGPGGILATADDNGHAYLWNTTARKIVATLTDPARAGVDSLAFGPNATLATGDKNGHTYVWNTTTGKIVATLADPASTGVDSVAFGPDGILATGDNNGHAYLWNTTTGKIVAALPDPASTGVDSVAFGPSGTVLATGDNNGHTYLWNITYHES